MESKVSKFGEGGPNKELPHCEAIFKLGEEFFKTIPGICEKAKNNKNPSRRRRRNISNVFSPRNLPAISRDIHYAIEELAINLAYYEDPSIPVHSCLIDPVKRSDLYSFLAVRALEKIEGNNKPNAFILSILKEQIISSYLGCLHSNCDNPELVIIMLEIIQETYKRGKQGGAFDFTQLHKYICCDVKEKVVAKRNELQGGGGISIGNRRKKKRGNNKRGNNEISTKKKDETQEGVCAKKISKKEIQRLNTSVFLKLYENEEMFLPKGLFDGALPAEGSNNLYGDIYNSKWTPRRKKVSSDVNYIANSTLKLLRKYFLYISSRYLYEKYKNNNALKALIFDELVFENAKRWKTEEKTFFGMMDLVYETHYNNISNSSEYIEALFEFMIKEGLERFENGSSKGEREKKIKAENIENWKSLLLNYKNNKKFFSLNFLKMRLTKTSFELSKKPGREIATVDNQGETNEKAKALLTKFAQILQPILPDDQFEFNPEKLSIEFDQKSLPLIIKFLFSLFDKNADTCIKGIFVTTDFGIACLKILSVFHTELFPENPEIRAIHEIACSYKTCGFKYFEKEREKAEPFLDEKLKGGSEKIKAIAGAFTKEFHRYTKEMDKIVKDVLEEELGEEPENKPSFWNNKPKNPGDDPNKGARSNAPGKSPGLPVGYA